MRIVLAFLFLLFFVPAGYAAGTEYPMLHVTATDGLPSDVIYFLYRDSRGYMWIATDKGIARYNGLKVEVFTTLNGLPDNEIYCIREDKQQRVWFGSYSGALCYYKNDTFFTAKNKTFLHLPYDVSYVRLLTCEFDSSMLISFYEGNKFMEVKGEKCRYFDLSAECSKHGITLNSMMKRKISSELYEIYETRQVITVDTNGRIRDIRASDHHIENFTQSQDQVYSYTARYNIMPDGTTLPFPGSINTTNPYYTLHVSNKHVLYGTGKGAYIDDSINLLPDLSISAITQDAAGNFWLGTLSKGIFCINADGATMKVHPDVYHGKIRYYHSDGTNISFATTNNELFVLQNEKVRNIISMEYVRQHNVISKGQSGNLTSKANAHYMYCGEKCLYVKNILAPTPTKNIYTLTGHGHGYKNVIEKDSQIFICRFQAIHAHSKKENEQSSDCHVISLEKDRVYSIAMDEQQDIWYSTRHHMYKLKGDVSEVQQQFDAFPLKTFVFMAGYMIGYTFDDRPVICNNVGSKVVCSYVPSANCIWDQLWRLDSVHMLITTNDCHRLLTVQRSAGAPVYSLDVIDDPFLPLDPEAVTANTANCYFFKNGSIISANMRDLFRKRQPPVLFFKTLRTENAAYAIDSSVEVPYAGSEKLRMSFSVVSFNSKQLSYQYAVDGEEGAAWKPIEDNELYLVNLPFGDHDIRIRALTSSGIYSVPVSFRLHILRPYWRTWWFMGITSCLVIAFVWISVIVIKRSALRAAEQKQLQMDLEIKAIYSQINPHFIFNTLNSALSLVRTKRSEEAYEHISQFSRLLRSYIRSSRNKLTTIADEINDLRDYLELQRTRFGNRFGFNIMVADTIDAETVRIPSLLLQPFVENALNHGLQSKNGIGNLTIGFENGKERNEVVCRIEDDGIGRKQAAMNNAGRQRASYGDLLIRDLVSIFNRYEQMRISIAYIDKEPPFTGTTVIINIKDLHYEREHIMHDSRR